MVVRFRVEVDSGLPPERILAAFTDFSERRPDLWPQLSRKLYEVHSLDETSADVTEGSDRPISVWARERYDWSEPGVVRWTVTESNFSVPGHTMVVRVEPRESGSHVSLDYDRGVTGVKGTIAGALMKLFGKRIITTYYGRTFRSWAAG
jgi:hypothetical protein